MGQRLVGGRGSGGRARWKWASCCQLGASLPARTSSLTSFLPPSPLPSSPGLTVAADAALAAATSTPADIIAGPTALPPVGVADVVEAMSSNRPYRPAIGVEPALQEIEHRHGAGCAVDHESRVVIVRRGRDEAGREGCNGA